MGELTHFDAQGNARMVDVSEKADTERMAIASGTIRVCREILEAIAGGTVKKGDVLTVAQVAGIMGAKRTSELIPMCHIIKLTGADLTFSVHQLLDGDGVITARCKVRTVGKTGVGEEYGEHGTQAGNLHRNAGCIGGCFQRVCQFRSAHPALRPSAPSSAR